MTVHRSSSDYWLLSTKFKVQTFMRVVAVHMFMKWVEFYNVRNTSGDAMNCEQFEAINAKQRNAMKLFAEH